ncbi:MAG: hypothetical protein OXL37_11590 [Chloroflexota bacterium]|nr:hypothetical protein [Chloroflexota bacterium]MDE2960527.1 hypothetical protein [Chloroflexota bacterium]
MTTITIREQARTIFDDARAMHHQSLERLDAGDLRDAAEKAWCATKRATDALILARTGEKIETSSGTTQELVRLVRTDRDLRPLRGKYFDRQSALHEACFYLGACDPEDDEKLIRETAQYLNDAERLAFL